MSISYEFNRRFKVDIWKQVLEDFKNNIDVESIVYKGLNTKEYFGFPKRVEKTEIEFVQKDCVYAAIDNVRLGFDPLLLNMASERVPGGGVRKGCAAQEEELFRRSDYFRHLHFKYYPLDEMCNIISEKVLFYRLAADGLYNLMKSPTKIDCIAAAALRHPTLDRTGMRFYDPDEQELFKEKIRMLFYSAYKHGNDCLILSAWGCGAFGCPTEHVAALFKEVIAENEGRFKKIVFAIFDDDNFKRFTNGYEHGIGNLTKLQDRYAEKVIVIKDE
jgi:uncharacterized protein (TIGR02452 family)